MFTLIWRVTRWVNGEPVSQTVEFTGATVAEANRKYLEYLGGLHRGFWSNFINCYQGDAPSTQNDQRTT